MTPPPKEAAFPDLGQRLLAEALGSCFLVCAVVGSGIMAERLSGGNAALALLCNTMATGAALVALILTFAPVSGAHLNPAVTLSDALQGGLPWPEVPRYIGAQILGAFGGAMLANGMFGERIITASRHARAGGGQMVGELVATTGLLLVIAVCSRRRPASTPLAVASFITAGYWFTSSTSFANPAVTLARSVTDTFTGIRPADVPGFVAAQLLGVALATVLVRFLLRPGTTRAIVIGARSTTTEENENARQAEGPLSLHR